MNSFHPDERLPLSERSELSDYARSGYDRGHIAPRSQDGCFTLANTIPQETSVNRGIWERIESGVRRMTKARGGLYVITGSFRGLP